MADPSPDGFWAIVAAAIPGLGLLGWELHKDASERRRDRLRDHQEEEDETQADGLQKVANESLIASNQQLRQDCADLRAERARLTQEIADVRKCAALWERRARRIDTEAHDLRHRFNNLAQIHGFDGWPKLPFLEDPFT